MGASAVQANRNVGQTHMGASAVQANRKYQN